MNLSIFHIVVLVHLQIVIPRYGQFVPGATSWKCRWGGWHPFLQTRHWEVTQAAFGIGWIRPCWASRMDFLLFSGGCTDCCFFKVCTLQGWHRPRFQVHMWSICGIWGQTWHWLVLLLAPMKMIVFPGVVSNQICLQVQKTKIHMFFQIQRFGLFLFPHCDASIAAPDLLVWFMAWQKSLESGGRWIPMRSTICCTRRSYRPWFLWFDLTGVIILPILGGIKHYKSMAIFRDFPHSNALFGLVM